MCHRQRPRRPRSGNLHRTCWSRWTDGARAKLQRTEPRAGRDHAAQRRIAHHLLAVFCDQKIVFSDARNSRAHITGVPFIFFDYEKTFTLDRDVGRYSGRLHAALSEHCFRACFFQFWSGTEFNGMAGAGGVIA